MLPSCLRMRSRLVSDDYLTWHRVQVQGRPAEYGVAGPDGPPVVFLHGYAMGSHAYKRPLRRLARRGCRVWAPAMPSFGATADLPPGNADLAGYAAWTADFIAEMGIDEPIILIGHSFGGAVAVKLAHRRPDLVGHVVLLNAVGGVSPRPVLSWAAGFTREFLSIGQTVELAFAARDDIITNIVRNPLGLLRAGRIAGAADVRAELADLRALGVPALVLTSEGDSVIPLRSFEAVCDFLGTAGQVVSGNHSWLLTDPESFNDVLSSVIDVEVASRRRKQAQSRAGQLKDLLARTRMPADTVESLVATAAPMWLTSEALPALAADLALCHPPLATGEVRAAVSPTTDRRRARLTVVAGDRPGLLADSASVLAGHGLSVVSATATTWPDRRLALHAFTVEGRRELDEDGWASLGQDLRAMGGVDPAPAAGRRTGLRPSTVDAYPVGDGMFLVKLTAPDRVGVLATACRWFADQGLSIQAVNARTAGPVADDAFMVAAPGGPGPNPGAVGATVAPATMAAALKRYLEKR